MDLGGRGDGLCAQADPPHPQPPVAHSTEYRSPGQAKKWLLDLAPTGHPVCRPYPSCSGSGGHVGAGRESPDLSGCPRSGCHLFIYFLACVLWEVATRSASHQLEQSLHVTPTVGSQSECRDTGHVLKWGGRSEGEMGGAHLSSAGSGLWLTDAQLLQGQAWGERASPPSLLSSDDPQSPSPPCPPSLPPPPRFLPATWLAGVPDVDTVSRPQCRYHIKLERRLDS